MGRGILLPVWHSGVSRFLPNDPEDRAYPAAMVMVTLFVLPLPVDAAVTVSSFYGPLQNNQVVLKWDDGDRDKQWL